MRVTGWLRVGLVVCSLLPTISGYAIRDTRAVIVEKGIIVTYVADPSAFASQLSKRQENKQTTEPPSKTQSKDAKGETSAPATKPETGVNIDGMTGAVTSKAGPTHTDPAPTISGDSKSAVPTQAPDKNGLPYTPPLTAAFAFAGFLLLVAGVPYTLAGVRHKQIHIFLSTALLASLGVSVLIIYVMNPPVSNALQGGYVAAVAITGLIFGGLAVIFPEVTEVLACLLGGFCLAQWFLVLKPGGLVTGGYQKIIFILCFSIGLFCLALHHVTRPYGMIFSIAFSGATVTVLGIDFFSRAGLKEFWLYVWGLNDNIFPLGTKTFPLTRGIRVEIAAIVVITCFGIISQMKLWQVIKVKREEREEARVKRQADLEAMEAENGRRVEEAAQRDREIWEKQYGDKSQTTTTLVADGQSPKASAELKQKKHLSHDSGLGQSSKNSTDGGSSKNEDSIEMIGLKSVEEGIEAQVPVPTQPQDGTTSTQPILESTTSPTENAPASTTEAGPASATPPVPQFFTPAVVIREKGDVEAETATIASSKTGLAAPTAIHTVIIDPTKEEDDDDASSLATFADSVRDDHRISQAISIASIAPLDQIQEVPHDDAASSVCGVLDDEDERSDGEMPLIGDDTGKRRSVISLSGRRGSWSSNKRLSIVSIGRRGSVRSTKSNKSQKAQSPQAQSPIDTTAEKVLEDKTDLVSEFSAELTRRMSVIGESEAAGSRRPSLTPEIAISEAVEKSAIEKESEEQSQSRRQSVATSVRPDETAPMSPGRESAGSGSSRVKSKKELKAPVIGPPAPLRQASLQHVRPPTKIVKTYRVSEWAKHLDPADEPQYDEMETLEQSEAAQEKAAPVHVMDLQEGTSSPRVPPPIAGLSKSDTFNSMQSPNLSRSNTLSTIREQPGYLPNMQPQILPSQLPQVMLPMMAPTSPQIPTVVIASPPPSRSGQLPFASPIISQPVLESPAEEGEGEQRTPTPPPMCETLLTKRVSMLKGTPAFSNIPDPSVTYGQILSGQQPQQPSLVQFPASASSPNLLSRQSMSPTPSGYQSHRNSNGTNYAGSMISGFAPSSRIPSMEMQPGALSNYNPYMNQSSMSMGAIPVPQGPVETAPQGPPQPNPSDRRDNMLKKWRESLAQDQVISARQQSNVQGRRNEMIQQHHMMSAYERQKEVERGLREEIIDQRYQQRDMLQVHRDAMKRMQEKAKGI
ncbi:hypothetical protein TWF694_006426 [Orbilia ellipsospora]|uniref:TM7S3/TM198-like domain-containing protein n=1 Tax=Orbilia ellipsospora TaxID=2528407 RepID=A0AAV9XKG6_9PEZI